MRKPRVNRSERQEEISGLFCGAWPSARRPFVSAPMRARPLREAFLLRVLESEAANREEVRKARYLREAGFPVLKTLAGYEYQNQTAADARPGGPGLRRVHQGPEEPGPLWAGRDRQDPSGDGPRRRGLRAEHPDPLLHRRAAGRSPVGSLCRRDPGENAGLDPEGRAPDPGRMGLRADRQARRQLLFRIISDSYERRSLIITTNTEFSKWGSIFTDDQMAAAMIDRLAHHGHILLFEGESYRMKHALMRQRHF